MNRQTIIDYVMNDPSDTNRAILMDLLKRLDGVPNGKFSVEDVANYVMYTKNNTNRAVLDTMLRSLNNEHPIRNKRTVLYADGTFIINESAKDIEKNVQLHGEMLNEYPPLDEEHPYAWEGQQYRYWANEIEQIKFAKFGSPVKPTSMRAWFAYCTELESFDTTNLDTSECTLLNMLFAGTSGSDLTKLKSLDLSSFNTSKVTSMKQMFYRCTALETLNISSFDTSNVETMEQMFGNCSSLTELDVSHFNTSSVERMAGMFNNCSSLTELDVSNFDTSNVTNMSSIFNSCFTLTTIYASDSFVVEQVLSDGNMFANDTSLVGGAGTTYVNTTTGKGKTYARIDNPPDVPGYFTAK